MKIRKYRDLRLIEMFNSEEPIEEFDTELFFNSIKKMTVFES